LLPDWRGALLGWLTLVWVANVYMSLFGRLRLDIKRERVEIKVEEQEAESKFGRPSEEVLKSVTPSGDRRSRDR